MTPSQEFSMMFHFANGDWDAGENVRQNVLLSQHKANISNKTKSKVQSFLKKEQRTASHLQQRRKSLIWELYQARRLEDTDREYREAVSSQTTVTPLTRRNLETEVDEELYQRCAETVRCAPVIDGVAGVLNNDFSEEFSRIANPLFYRSVLNDATLAVNEYAQGKNDTTGVIERKRVGAMMEQTLQAEYHRLQSPLQPSQFTTMESDFPHDFQEDSNPPTSAVIANLTNSYVPHTFHGSQATTEFSPVCLSSKPALSPTSLKATTGPIKNTEFRGGNVELSIEAVTGLERERPQKGGSISTSGHFGTRTATNRPITYEEMDWLLDESAVLGRFGSGEGQGETEGKVSVAVAKQALEISRLKYQTIREKGQGRDVRGQKGEMEAWDVVLIAQLRYAASLTSLGGNYAQQAIEYLHSIRPDFVHSGENEGLIEPQNSSATRRKQSLLGHYRLAIGSAYLAAERYSDATKSFQQASDTFSQASFSLTSTFSSLKQRALELSALCLFKSGQLEEAFSLLSSSVVSAITMLTAKATPKDGEKDRLPSQFDTGKNSPTFQFSTSANFGTTSTTDTSSSTLPALCPPFRGAFNMFLIAHIMNKPMVVGVSYDVLLALNPFVGVSFVSSQGLLRDGNDLSSMNTEVREDKDKWISAPAISASTSTSEFIVAPIGSLGIARQEFLREALFQGKNETLRRLIRLIKAEDKAKAKSSFNSPNFSLSSSPSCIGQNAMKALLRKLAPSFQTNWIRRRLLFRSLATQSSLASLKASASTTSAVATTPISQTLSLPMTTSASLVETIGSAWGIAQRKEYLQVLSKATRVLLSRARAHSPKRYTEALARLIQALRAPKHAAIGTSSFGLSSTDGKPLAVVRSVDELADWVQLALSIQYMQSGRTDAALALLQELSFKPLQSVEENNTVNPSSSFDMNYLSKTQKPMKSKKEKKCQGCRSTALSMLSLLFATKAGEGESIETLTTMGMNLPLDTSYISSTSTSTSSLSSFPRLWEIAYECGARAATAASAGPIELLNLGSVLLSMGMNMNANMSINDNNDTTSKSTDFTVTHNRLQSALKCFQRVLRLCEEDIDTCHTPLDPLYLFSPLTLSSIARYNLGLCFFSLASLPTMGEKQSENILYHKAVEVLLPLHSSDPEDIPVAILLADIHLAWSDAISTFNSASGSMSFNTPSAQELREKALRWIGIAVSLSPEDPILLEKKGALTAELVSQQAALPLYQNALEVDPSSLPALAFLGVYAVKTNDLATAARHFAIASEADSTTQGRLRWRLLLGSVASKMGQKEAALGLFLRIHHEHPRSEETLQYIVAHMRALHHEQLSEFQEKLLQIAAEKECAS